MPRLVPTSPDDPGAIGNQKAWEVLSQLSTPFLCAFSDGDPITGAMAPVLRRALPGAQGREHPVIAGAGHFLQEDAGPALAARIARFIEQTPTQ